MSTALEISGKIIYLHSGIYPKCPLSWIILHMSIRIGLFDKPVLRFSLFSFSLMLNALTWILRMHFFGDHNQRWNMKDWKSMNWKMGSAFLWAVITAIIKHVYYAIIGSISLWRIAFCHSISCYIMPAKFGTLHYAIESGISFWHYVFRYLISYFIMLT